MASPNPFQFLEQVRAEAGKVTWPTRRETLVTTGLVFVMSAAAALLFTLIDAVIRTGLAFLLGLGR